MKNIAHFTTEELLYILGDFSNFTVPSDCVGISADTRTLQQGNLYIAIRGEYLDGHTFISKAKELGAIGVIVDRHGAHQFSTELSDFPHIIVDNTLHALGKLAQFHRKRYDIHIVAIAGAAGKTSTKDCTAYILSKKFVTLKTYANYNNQIGVPLMLLQLDDTHQVAVIEIGTNEPGEIEALSEIVLPTHGLITNIGKEHLEKLIDLDGVEKEETALFRYLDRHSGITLINIDDERLHKYTGNKKTLTYSMYSLASDISCTWQINSNGFATISFIVYADKLQEQNQFKTLIHMPGKVGIMTAIASSAIAFACGMNLQEIANALSDYVPPEYHGYGRMAMQEIGNIQILNDSYNANPASMSIALETLSGFTVHGKKIAVLGDMRELGNSSLQEHIEILQLAIISSDLCIITGQEMYKAYTYLEVQEPSLIYAETLDICTDIIKKEAKKGDIVLIKGSRGIQLENVLIAWKNSLIHST
jgi:UDP-N-acetylmuramoyl-tripeptide--D-alanyl-D-alanine ligase